MKIEKINENQIRCTLTHHDLADRELKISELAYGSDKAKTLFKDMMDQASYQFGFEADGIPLMIEAVPLSAECVVLTITKVEDPEELDTRFSKFAPSVHDDSDIGEISEAEAESDISEDVMDLFQRVQNSNSDFFSDISRIEKFSDKKSAQARPGIKTVDFCSYRFDSLQHLIRLSHAVGNFVLCPNTLYKNKSAKDYRLVIYNRQIEAKDFNKLCNAVSEYGHFIKQTDCGEAYYKEHYDIVVKEHALQSLSEI